LLGESTFLVDVFFFLGPFFFSAFLQLYFSPPSPPPFFRLYPFPLPLLVGRVPFFPFFLLFHEVFDGSFFSRITLRGFPSFLFFFFPFSLIFFLYFRCLHYSNYAVISGPFFCPPPLFHFYYLSTDLLTFRLALFLLLRPLPLDAPCPFAKTR